MRGVFIGYDCSDIGVRVDPDAYWEDFLTWDSEERAEAVATNGLHWRVILDIIDLPQEAKEGFWNEFKKKEKLMNRKRALVGLVVARREEEILLIERTRQMQSEFKQSIQRACGACDGCEDGDFRKVLEVLRQWEPSLAAIGSKFSNLIYEKDFKALRRIADILEDGNEVNSQKMKGGVESPDGKMLRAFVALHVKNRNLPTRDLLSIESGVMDEKAASRSAIKLGLSGLPL